MTGKQCDSCIWKVEDRCGITGAKANHEGGCQKWNKSFSEIVDILVNG